MANQLVEDLFASEAVKVSPDGEMFFSTSGLITPYYINTQFLCGGEVVSAEILSLIDEVKIKPELIVTKIKQKIIELSYSNEIYDRVTTSLVNFVKNSGKNFDFVSGGERRDWFFSIPVAERLNLKHLYIFNDGLILDDEARDVEKLEVASVLHVADLLTVGSSYTSKWLPYLTKLGVNLEQSLNCVDRDQGGESNLKNAGISNVDSLITIDEAFFIEALNAKVISDSQYTKLISYYRDQFASMRSFLVENPEFISKALASDPKTVGRVKITLENDLYKLGEGLIKKFKSS